MVRHIRRGDGVQRFELVGGGSAKFWEVDRDGAITDELGSYAHLTLQPGEAIVGHTCGGGGYGAFYCFALGATPPP